MFYETVEKFGETAKVKSVFLNKSIPKYIVASVMAGIYVGIGIILTFSIGGPLKEAASPFVKLVMGAGFGIALTLVIFAGSELFTGNNMIMTFGVMEKKATFAELIKIWWWSFIGNLAGALILAFLMANSGLVTKGAVNALILSASEMKMNTPFIELFIRGILCNMMVCLAIWSSTKAKEEPAKLILIWWCLFAFVSSGFEHSIANMTLLGMALFIPHDAAISWMGFANNMVPVTLGNIVGGLAVGLGYWFISANKVEK